MAKLTAIIGADSSRFVEEVKSAKYMLEKFVTETQKAIDKTEDATSVTNEQVNAYKNVIKSLEKIASGTMNTGQQQKALSAALQELKIQWANLSDEAKSGEFGKMLASTLSESKIALSQLSEQINQVNNELGNASGSASAKRQLASVSKELTNLTLQYRTLSDAEKQSAQGQELARKLDQLREKAGFLKDTVGDVQQEIKVLASDTPNLDVFNDVIGLSADALSTYSSLLAKVTGDEKSLKNAIATVMAVQSAANLVTKVTNALQSSSAIMLKVRAIQEKAAAAAINLRAASEKKGVVATQAATAAQRVFNAVAKANPYVLLATAILAVVGAIAAYTIATNKATAAEEKLKKENEDFRNELKATSREYGENRIKLQELQDAWKSLKSEQEKNEFIKNNAEEFKKLGVEISNVKDAENLLIKNSDAFIRAMEMRAKAQAHAALAAKYYQEALEKGDEADKRRNSPEWQDKVMGILNTRWGESFDKSIQREANRSANHIRTEQYQRERDAEKHLRESQELEKEADETLKEADIKQTSKTNTTKTNTVKNKVSTKETHKVEVKVEADSLTDLENQLSKLQNDYKNGLKPEMNKEEYLEEVGKLEKRIEKKKIELGLEVGIPEGSLKEIDELLSKKKTELSLAVDDESRAKVQSEIEELTRKKREIELKIKPVVEEKDLRKLFEDLSSHEIEVRTKIIEEHVTTAGASKTEKAVYDANSLKNELDFNKQILSSYKEQYNLIKQKQAAGADLTTSEMQLVNVYEDVTRSVNDLSDAYEQAAENARKLSLNASIKDAQFDAFKTGVSTVGGFNSSISGLISKYNDLSEDLEDKSSFERFSAAVDATISTIETAISAYESINKMIQLFDEISDLSAAKKVAANAAVASSDTALTATETANTQVKIANDEAENASTIGKLGVKEADSMASATSSGAKLPFPANIAAIAAGIAAVVAAFSMAFSAFAEGGIVNSGSKTGDYNLVRVNGGEMILNGTQQKRLFNLLNGEVGYATINNKKNKVVFEIKGSKLAGTLKNYYSKTNKL